MLFRINWQLPGDYPEPAPGGAEPIGCGGIFIKLVGFFQAHAINGGRGRPPVLAATQAAASGSQHSDQGL